MPKNIKILHVEDSRTDAELVKRAMRSERNLEWHWVINKEQYLHELECFRPDIILCDHSLPGFNSEEALEILKEKQLTIPFILITGTISEEFAVMMMKKGVTDYLLKDRIQRLPSAIAHALGKREAEQDKERHMEELIKNEANLTAIIENSDAHIYSLDKDFRYLTFNSHLKKILYKTYGLDIHEGDVIYDFLNKLDPDEAKEWERMYRLAFSGKSLRFVKEFKVDGVHTFTSFSINPIREGSNTSGLSCFGWDITEQKLAEDRLTKSEARFRALIENNYDAIILRDENLNIIYRSPSANKMIGYPANEVLSGEIYDSIHPEDRDLLHLRLPELMANPGKAYQMRLRTRHRDGHFIWLEGSMRNMLDNENVKGIIFNYRDISDRMELEQQREKMIKDITQRVNDLEQFTYIVSHNLRSPVANILGLSNILQHSNAEENDRIEAIDGIHHSAHKLDDVIMDLNNILLKKQTHNEPVQIVLFHELIDDIEISLSNVIEASHASIITDFKAATGMTAIKSYLYSIFYNLITNSIKYRQDCVSPSITIASFHKNDKTVITFKDNGRGIDLVSGAKEIFGLYKRFHPEIEGKGMGLFMVKTQVESLGGTISVKSEVNEGTEFTIEL